MTTNIIQFPTRARNVYHVHVNGRHQMTVKAFRIGEAEAMAVKALNVCKRDITLRCVGRERPPINTNVGGA